MSLQFGKSEIQLDCGLTTEFDTANRSLLHPSTGFCSYFVAGHLLSFGAEFLSKASNLPHNLGNDGCFVDNQVKLAVCREGIPAW